LAGGKKKREVARTAFDYAVKLIREREREFKRGPVKIFCGFFAAAAAALCI